MFVSTLKTLGAAALIISISAVGATAADESGDIYEEETIPVTVNLTGVQVADGPIYITVQKQEEYMGMKGHRAILKTITPGNMTTVVNVAEPGDYAVSIWHDMDADMFFDMDQTYRPSEGWGASGSVTTSRMPTFNDVKVKIGSFGTTVNVPLIYPS